MGPTLTIQDNVSGRVGEGWREQDEGWREGDRRQEEGREQVGGGEGRNKERVGGKEEGRERGREGECKGRDEPMMLGRQRASVEEGRVEGGMLMKGTSEEGTGPGMDGGSEK